MKDQQVACFTIFNYLFNGKNEVKVKSANKHEIISLERKEPNNNNKQNATIECLVSVKQFCNRQNNLVN